MSYNYLTLNRSKTEFLLIGLLQQTSKITNCSLSLPTAQPILPTPLQKNLGFIFDFTLSLSPNRSILHFKFLSLYSRSVPYPTQHQIHHPFTIAITSLVHSQLDYCNSLYHSLPITQLKRLQQIQNALAPALLSTHTSLLQSNLFTGRSRSMHTIQNHIYYTQSLHKSEPTHHINLISIKPTGKTRSANHLCPFLSPLTYKLKFSDHSFHKSSPCLWNSLPINLRSFSELPLHLPCPCPLSLLFHLLHTLSISQSIPLLP